MVFKLNKKSAAASFGVAMTSLFFSTDIQAEIVPITWDGGNAQLTLFAEGGFNPYDPDPEIINIDQVVGPEELSVFNTFHSNGVNLYQAAYPLGELTGLEIVQEDQILKPSTFFPTTIGFTGFGTMGRTAGFRTSNGNVGWFKIEDFLDLGIEGWIVFTQGEYGTAGETLKVGGTPNLGDINCDGAVNLLDVGPFIQLLTDGTYLDKADFNFDGSVNLLDVGPFIDALNTD